MQNDKPARPGHPPVGRAAARRGVRTRSVVTATAVLAAVAPFVMCGPARAAAPAAPVTARWTTRTLAPGVQLRSATLRRADSHPSWTVTVQEPVTSRLTGAATAAEVGPRSWADPTAAALRAAGFSPRVESVRWPDYSDTPHGTMGERVRVGSYPSQTAAADAAHSLVAAGFPTAVAEWTGFDADQPADVENVHVVVIDPHVFTGTVEGTHDGDVAQRETTSSVAARLGSLVAVNGGFFVTADSDGVQGTQSGLGVYGGELESMSAGARAALVLGGDGHARTAVLSSTAEARADGSSHPVQGVNRVPGTVRDCGRPGAVPSVRPWQDVTCHESDDLVLFTPEFADALPTGDGTQAVLDPAGRVVSVGGRGGQVPAGGSVLQGVGPAADWLTAHARVGERVPVTETVRDAAGRRVPLGPGDSVVSAAPMLVEDGRTNIDAATEGTVDPRDLSFGYVWADGREPRTMAGVDARGRLILATVDGHQMGGSEGFTLEEEAGFMRSLGAVEAMNLDGGGSTTMAIDGVLVNRPSDATGERPVGDSVQVLPGGGG